MFYELTVEMFRARSQLLQRSVKTRIQYVILCIMVTEWSLKQRGAEGITHRELFVLSSLWIEIAAFLQLLNSLCTIFSALIFFDSKFLLEYPKVGHFFRYSPCASPSETRFSGHKYILYKGRDDSAVRFRCTGEAVRPNIGE